MAYVYAQEMHTEYMEIKIDTEVDITQIIQSRDLPSLEEI
jgi:hypothetical protein